MNNSQEILPSIPCSRNLRRRTGIWLGLEAVEIIVCLCLSMIPDIAYRIGLIGKTSLLVGFGITIFALGMVTLFKHNKPHNYFTLWLHHHFLHPDGWRAPRCFIENEEPILDDSNSENHEIPS